LISVTLEENISVAERLINEIRSKFHIPVVLGGSATKQIPIGSIIDIIIIRNGSQIQHMPIDSTMSNPVYNTCK
jgi:hypothetical protein